MQTLKNLLSDVWESTMGRFAILVIAVGAVPVYFLSMAVALIRK